MTTRRSRKPARRAFSFACDRCGGLVSSVRGQSRGYHTYEGDDGGYDHALTSVVASWWRSVENGSVQSIELIVGTCGNYMATEHGRFTASVAELDKLRRAIAVLQFASPDARARAGAILAELAPLEEEAVESQARLDAHPAAWEARRAAEQLAKGSR